GNNTEQGSFEGPCGCGGSGGTGTGMIEGLSYSMPLYPGFTFGASILLDSKNASSSTSFNEQVIVEYTQNANERIDTTTVLTNRNMTITTTYISIAPYMQFYPLEAGPFIQVA